MAIKYLRLEDRLVIAKRYAAKVPTLDIAVELGCHPSTIYAELKRGQAGELDKNQRPGYDPRKAQEIVQQALRRRGPKRKR